MTTAKAILIVDPEFLGRFPVGVPPAPQLLCHYNPTQLAINGGGEWSHPDANQQHELGAALFTKPKPRSMSLELLLDGDGLLADAAILFDWTHARTSPTGQASAPWLRLQWGARTYFRCYIESLQVTYTMFASSGMPIRATATVGLTETADPLPFTNPTSGGQGSERSHVVIAGDTLHSIAHRHYGRPQLWRGLAAINNIDDPLRLATGAVVQLPPVAEIEECC